MISPPPVPSNRDDEAYDLMSAAAKLAPAGEWLQAADRLERAAGLHALAGRAYDEARCLQMAATLLRSAGQIEAAGRLIDRSRAVAQADDRLTLSIHAEHAEIASAAGELDEAIDAWSSALACRTAAGLGPDGTSALLRRRAAGLLAADRLADAAADFDAARRLMTQAHGPELAGFVRTEQAGLLWNLDKPAETRRVLAQLAEEIGAVEPADPHLRAELLVLRARIAHAERRLDQALADAHAARESALTAVAPVTYLAASVELAGILESRELPADAYATLATTLVTLADAVGDETARSWVEPVLIDARLRWGIPGFDAAKAEYERRRRDDLDGRA
jgi:tetratricopeptide (TPR) repeat protein